MNGKLEIVVGRVCVAKKGALPSYKGMLTVKEIMSDGVICSKERHQKVKLDRDQLIPVR